MYSKNQSVVSSLAKGRKSRQLYFWSLIHRPKPAQTEQISHVTAKRYDLFTYLHFSDHNAPGFGEMTSAKRQG